MKQTLYFVSFIFILFAPIIFFAYYLFILWPLHIIESSFLEALLMCLLCFFCSLSPVIYTYITHLSSQKKEE